jgi:hypothetical protein
MPVATPAQNSIDTQLKVENAGETPGAPSTTRPWRPSAIQSTKPIVALPAQM